VLVPATDFRQGDEPYGLFGNVLSARPDLKKYAALRFRQEVKRHPEPGEDGPELVLVFLEALDLDPPLTLVSSDLHPPGARGKGTNQASPAPCSSRSKPRAAMVNRMAIEPKLQAEWIRR
jgi:hypothetical protein